MLRSGNELTLRILDFGLQFMNMNHSIDHSRSYNSDSLSVIKADEFLPSGNVWMVMSGWLIVGSVGLAVGLASVSKYNVTVKTQAIVRPIGELRLVQATKEGIINSISVANNQVVKQGDILATIDTSQIQTMKSQLIGNIHNSQQQLNQVAGQIASLDQQITSESNLMQWTVSSAQADLNRSQRDYQDRQVITQADVAEANAALELAKSQMEQYQGLADTGAVPKGQIVEKEQSFKMAKARLERVKAVMNPSDAPLKIANDRIAQEIARGKSTLATLQKERISLIQRQIEIQNQLNRDRRELQQIQSDLQKSLVKAPIDGIILNLNLRNLGQFVRSGEEIAQIAPSRTKFVLRAMVSAEDISKVKIGQKTQLRLSACPYPDYGVLSGQVTAISPDAIGPPSSSTKFATNQPTSNISSLYEVSIKPDSLTFGQTNYKCSLKLGMEGRVDILTKQETVLQFVLRRARLIADV